MKTLLSIDWDFFMPDVAPYDWGHQESELFYEMIWGTRCSSVNLLTKQLAVDAVIPDKDLLHAFWPSTVSGKPEQLFIADSHLDLYKVLEKIGPCLIDNCDAHHDFGYSDEFKDVDCGNWALRAWEKGLNPSYRLFYPEWRRKSPENIPPWYPRDEEGDLLPIFHGLNLAPNRYDFIFICRSSAWTPPWADPEWTKFIRFWDSPWSFGRNVWKNRVTLSPRAEVERTPNMDQARLIAEKSHLQHARYFERLKARGIPAGTIISGGKR